MLSFLNWKNVIISLLSFAAFDGGKYFARNLAIISFPISVDFVGKELNHNLALSLSEKGKKSRHTVSAGTPLCFYVLHISRKLVICSFGLSL